VINSGCKNCRYLSEPTPSQALLGAHQCEHDINIGTKNDWYSGRQEVKKRHPSEINEKLDCCWFWRIAKEEKAE